MRRGKQQGLYTGGANASVRFPSDIYEELAAMAEIEDISIASILRRGAKAELSKYRSQQASA